MFTLFTLRAREDADWTRDEPFTWPDLFRQRGNRTSSRLSAPTCPTVRDVPLHNETLHIVCQPSLFASWFGDYGRCIYTAGFPNLHLSSSMDVDNALVIYDRLEVFTPNRARNIGAIAVGDETSIMDISWYSRASFVFRQFYDAQRITENVLWIPIGPKGADPGTEECAPSCRAGPTWEARTWPCFAKLQVASTRRYLLTFTGWLHNSNRVKMMDQVKKLDTGVWEFFVQDAGGYGPAVGPTGARGLNQTEMRSVLRDSIFCLAPCGNNPESHRVWEALWNGCIPIMEYCSETDCSNGVLCSPGDTVAHFPPDKNFVHHLLHRAALPPSIVLRDWRELGPLLMRHLAGGDWQTKIDKLQQTVMDWWFCFIKDSASRMEARMAERLVRGRTGD